jgi:hypothetical protein
MILFGSRFISDQTVLDLLAEFLAVAFASKEIQNYTIDEPLPALEILQRWPRLKGAKLKYQLPIKLNLKLLAFLCASPLDKRHEIHEEQYRHVAGILAQKILSYRQSPEEVREWVEDFLMGMQGAGFDRTWCAQTPYPISPKLLLQETIWNNTFAKSANPSSWQESLSNFKRYYSVTRHRFLARGGELLYLQLCNLFADRKHEVEKFAKLLGYYQGSETYENLYRSLVSGLARIMSKQLSPVDMIAEFIEHLDPETNDATNAGNASLSCEWCSQESWPEAYLFAIELSQLLQASLDPIERLELLQIGCAIQAMRSIAAQSIRYAHYPLLEGRGGALNYAWVFSPLSKCTRQHRLASCSNLQVNFKLIQRAINNPDILNHTNRNRGNKTIQSLITEANTRYGHKYFKTIGVRLGIIFPRTGAEPRFVLTDKFLRYMVLTVLKPGERCEYTTFKQRIYRHYGAAFEQDELDDALAWSELPVNSSIQSDNSSLLSDMLRAGGFLTELSDGCAIVANPFGREEGQQ